MLPRSPRFTLADTRFPYTRLFRVAGSAAAPRTSFSGRRGAVMVADCRMPLLPLDPIKGLSMPRWAWTGRTGGRTEVERSPWGRVASETGQRVRRWVAIDAPVPARVAADEGRRSEEHTSELQSLMRISYAVFCLKKKTTNTNHQIL